MYRKLSEPEQDGHTCKNIPRGVALLAEPGNVAFDGVAEPGCLDSVNGGGAYEIAIQHGNLLLETAEEDDPNA
jgi:hypothetical protein